MDAVSDRVAEVVDRKTSRKLLAWRCRKTSAAILCQRKTHHELNQTPDANAGKAQKNSCSFLKKHSTEALGFR
jgi:hypothetical protein